MTFWRTPGQRALALLLTGLLPALLASSPAPPAPDAPATPPESSSAASSEGWGTIISTDDCVQAHAWAVRVRDLVGASNAPLFGSRHPSGPSAPYRHTSGEGTVRLAPGGLSVGTGSGLYSGATGHAGAPGEVLAKAGAGLAEVGVPYVAGPAGGVQHSPFGVHAEGVSASARSAPGKRLRLAAGVDGGYFSLAGQRVADIPANPKPDHNINIPADGDQAPLAVATFNERVTTDRRGRPTLDKYGDYARDPAATSGYVNAVHISVLGAEVTEVTLGHAAVVRDPLNRCHAS